MSRAVMKEHLYHVHADWDPEVEVWVATSDDVPGLATEAATVELLTEKLRILIPELLEANQLLAQGHDHFAFELTSHRQEEIRLASWEAEPTASVWRAGPLRLLG